jgi:hypothetical protein
LSSPPIMVAVAILFSTPAHACEDGHWISEVLSDGAVISLEDGSIWPVDAIDQVDTALSLPISNIVVCPGMLINMDDNEKAHARRVR